MFVGAIKTLVVAWIALEAILAIVPSSSDANTVETVRQACKAKLAIDSIGSFHQFIEQLKSVAVELAANDPDLARCLEDRSALIELDELVRNYDRSRPCKSNEIDKLESFAKKYYAETKGKQPISQKFFKLFAVNVGFHCKLNLMAHLDQADRMADPKDFIYSMASPASWPVLLNELTKKSMKFGGSTNDKNEIAHRLASLVPGLSQVEQLDYLDFKHLLNDPIPTSWNGIEEETYHLSEGADHQRVRNSLTQIIRSCENLDRLYFNSILSLSRLKNLGLLVEFEFASVHHESSRILHKWLAAASFCQLMVRAQVTGQNNNLHLAIKHDDRLLTNRRSVYTYEASFEDISKEAKQQAWLAGLSEGRWRQRDTAVFRLKAIKHRSLAMNQLLQFVRGLERDLRSADDSANNQTTV